MRDGPRYATPEGLAVAECPVGYVTVRSWELVDLLVPALGLHEDAGIPVHQVVPEALEDARVLDALQVIRGCMAERAAAVERAVRR